MRAVLQVFENYQKARVNFVQTVAELATRPQNGYNFSMVLQRRLRHTALSVTFAHRVSPNGVHHG